MDPTDSTGDVKEVVNDDQRVTPRPIGQVTVRFEPAADALEARTPADGADARKGVEAPGLEEAGYGYGV